MTDSPQQRPVSRVLVAGGGTAGHIEPALAVADELSTRGVSVWALGTSRGLETDVVPARGHELVLIEPVPIPRKLSPALAAVPWKLGRSVAQTVGVLRRLRIDAVIGFGGYVSGPAYLASALTRTPFFVHEANARAGMANKLGARLGGTPLLAVDGCGLDGRVVGIPVRDAVATPADPQAAAQRRRAARQAFGLDEDATVVLVTGGSQGARSLNEATIGAAPRLLEQGLSILHAYGKKNEVSSTSDRWVCLPYIERMDQAYAAADLIVCRAGAMTVAEVTAARLPAVYVPLPHGNGEQALNSTAVVDAGGAERVADSDWDADRMVNVVTDILGNDDRRAGMAAAVAALPTSSASRTIADIVTGATLQA